MHPRLSTDYLADYPETLATHVRQLIADDRLAEVLLRKYPEAHGVRTDGVLYDCVLKVHGDRLRNAPLLSKVAFDSKLHVVYNVLGTRAAISRVQGGKLKAKREVRIASVFREMSGAFLRMVAGMNLHTCANTSTTRPSTSSACIWSRITRSWSSTSAPIFVIWKQLFGRSGVSRPGFETGFSCVTI